MRRPRLRILYAWYVDWRAIKQRHHFLAEELAARHDVLVVYRMQPERRSLPRNRSSVKRLPWLPLVMRRWGRVAERIDERLQRAWLSVVAAFFRPHAVLITFPHVYDYLPPRLKRLPVIYDAADDAPAFPASPGKRLRLLDTERRVLRRCSWVVTSSESLADVVLGRGAPPDRVTLVRNGISAAALASGGALRRREDMTDASRSTEAGISVGYVGGISERLDLEALMSCLSGIPELTLHLVGPVYTALPRHPRLVLHGSVEHDQLPRYADLFDACIVPYRLTPLTRSIDPVKLYEYLAWGREIFCIRYAEVERFEPFVHFYETAGQLQDLIEALRDGRLPPRAEKAAVGTFLEANTWERRAEVIDGIIVDLAARAT